MTRLTRRKVLSGVTALGVGGLAGCVGGQTVGDSANGADESSLSIAVGSKNFTEVIILGHMTAEVLESNTEYSVLDRMDYGNTPETLQGFIDGEIHTYWNYTGTMWMAEPPKHEEPVAGQEPQYEAVKAEAESEYDMRVLDMTSFENNWTFFAESGFREEMGIEVISDLAAYVNAGNYDLQVVVEDDFHSRLDGWPGLIDHYGFEQAALDAWDERNGVVVVDEGLTYDEVRLRDRDVGLGYTTDPQLSAYDLVTIPDDDNFWPHYNLLPVIAEEKATDEAVREINKIPPALGDADTMQRLNARHDIEGEDYEEIARSFLQDEGIIG